MQAPEPLHLLARVILLERVAEQPAQRAVERTVIRKTCRGLYGRLLNRGLRLGGDRICLGDRGFRVLLIRHG